ncbi:MAG: hypothetical protein Q8O88_01315 [bacterium]|nr:hypothetical protein [bacterium]
MVLYPRISVRVYPTDKDGHITSATYSEFSDILNLDVAKGIEKVKDTFSFEFPVYKAKNVTRSWINRVALEINGDKVIRVNDVVAIYAGYGHPNTFVDSNLLLHGVVKNFTITSADSQLRVKVKGANRTEEILKGFVPYTTLKSASATKEPVTTMIKNIVNRLNAHNRNHKIYAALTTETITITGTAGGLQTTKRDGTAFPSEQYNATWKPVYNQIEELSSEGYTGDKDAGIYIFYVLPIPVKPEFQLNDPSDNSTPGPFADVLYWQSPSVSVSSTLTEGSHFGNCLVTYDIRDIINAMIVNAGTDKNGNGILAVAYDSESMSRFGTRWGYYTQARKKFSDIETREIKLGIENGIIYDAKTSYPATAEYPYTMFVDVEGVTGSVATDEVAYNKALRLAAKTEATQEAQSVIEDVKTARYHITFDLDIGSNTLIAGNIHKFQIPSIGWEGDVSNPTRILRITDEVHTISHAGWQTRITAKEDQEVVRLQLEAQR